MWIALYLGALFAQSGECPSLLEQARNAYESRQFKAAASAFEQASTRCGANTAILLPLAKAQILDQQFEPALATLNRYLAQDAGNAEASKLKGDVLYFLGREQEAVEVLKQSQDRHPNDTAIRYALGRIYYQQNRVDDAAVMFRSILSTDPKNYRAHDNMALCYAAQRKDSEALQHFLKALELVHREYPREEMVHADAANFFLDRGEYQKAFQLGAEAAKRNPASARSFFVTGKALVKLEKPDLSVRWLREAVQIQPTYAEAHYLLGQVYRKLGKKDESDQELARFRELNEKPRSRR